jgi:hypothetical protein
VHKPTPHGRSCTISVAVLADTLCVVLRSHHRRSKGTESAEHLSTTGEDAAERPSGKDQAQDPPSRGVLEPASASTGQDDREPMNRESDLVVRSR